MQWKFYYGSNRQYEATRRTDLHCTALQCNALLRSAVNCNGSSCTVATGTMKPVN